MAYRWPAETAFKRMDVDVEDRSCPVCERYMHVCDHRYHHLWTFEGPTQVVNRLGRCPDPSCASRGRTFSPEAALSISMPRWSIGWDVFCWLGHRRFARHWSVPQLHTELQDTHQMRLSDDAIERYIILYHTRLAARQQDPQRRANDYQDISELVLTIDGLQPEKGHETLYVVRELIGKRVWFAEPLLSSATEEVRRLIVLARQWTERLSKPVRMWMSDKQDAFVDTIADTFSGTPHRDCTNHFLRALAKPVLDMDSHAKGQMRRKVRGLRAIERRVLVARQETAELLLTAPPETPKSAATLRADLPATATRPADAVPTPSVSSGLCLVNRASALDTACATTAWEQGGEPEVGEIVLDYCAAVRGILNDDQGGPLHPSGLRMSEALQNVRDALERNLRAKKGGAGHRC